MSYDKRSSTSVHPRHRSPACGRKLDGDERTRVLHEQLDLTFAHNNTMPVWLPPEGRLPDADTHPINPPRNLTHCTDRPTHRRLGAPMSSPHPAFLRCRRRSNRVVKMPLHYAGVCLHNG